MRRRSAKRCALRRACSRRSIGASRSACITPRRRIVERTRTYERYARRMWKREREETSGRNAARKISDLCCEFTGWRRSSARSWSCSYSDKPATVDRTWITVEHFLRFPANRSRSSSNFVSASPPASRFIYYLVRVYAEIAKFSTDAAVERRERDADPSSKFIRVCECCYLSVNVVICILWSIGF